MNLTAAIALWWFVQNQCMQWLLKEMKADSRYEIPYNDRVDRFYYLVGDGIQTWPGWWMVGEGVCQLHVYFKEGHAGNFARVTDRLCAVLVSHAELVYEK